MTTYPETFAAHESNHASVVSLNARHALTHRSILDDAATPPEHGLISLRAVRAHLSVERSLPEADRHFTKAFAGFTA